MRVALALPFFRSGLTRWDGFLSLSAGTLYLFEEQFRLHIFGGLYPLPAPDQTAFLVGAAELTLPVLLVVGLATRLAGFGLLIMTGVIQLVFSWMRFTSSARRTRSRMMGAASSESSHVLCITIVLRPPMKISDVYSSMARLLSATYGTYCGKNNLGV